jgi:large subunit ribosomal protein L4
MATVNVYNMKGEVTSNINLKDEIFNVEVNEHILHKAVKSILANKRQGTSKTKTRSEVRGGGKKPWRQKGTGHARQGTIRAPQWKGGGMVFALTPRDYVVELNKKEKKLALKSALTNAVKENNFYVIEEIAMDKIKTKEFQTMLNNLKLEKAFVVLDKNDQNVILSARNIEGVKTSGVNEINVYDIMKFGKVLVTKDAVKNIEEVYA